LCCFLHCLHPLDIQLNKLKLLTVCLITYNHKNYIQKAINSILSQKTSFEYDILIADDYSTDGTREFITDHAKNCPKTDLLLQDKNVGPYRNFIDLISKPKTQYIAYLEGDDYWLDCNKLQNQVDILEKYPNSSFCFSDVAVNKKQSESHIHPNLGGKTRKFSAIDLADQTGSFAQTCTLLIRRKFLQNLPEWVLNSYTLDWCLQIFLAKQGPAVYIPQTTAVYRIHNQGLWSKLDPFEGWRKNLKFYETVIDKFYNRSERKRIKKRISSLLYEALEFANVQANKKEIRYWLSVKLKKYLFFPIQQSLHSVRLLAFFK